MFTAVQPFCQQANTPLVLDGEPTFTASAASGQVTFSSAPFPSHVGLAYTGSAATGTLLAIQQFSSGATTFTYTLQYDGVTINMGYEGMLHVIGRPSGTVFVEVDAFGTVVVDRQLFLPSVGPPAATTVEFAFLHSGTSSTVVITVTILSISAEQTSIQFGLDRHMSSVVLPENECVSACPPRTGFTAGINGASNTPPVCVYCPNNLLQTFDPIAQSCECVLGRTNSNGVC